MTCHHCFLDPCQCDMGGFGNTPHGYTPPAPEEAVLPRTVTRSARLEALVTVHHTTDERLDTPSAVMNQWERRFRWHVNQIPLILHTIREALIPLRAVQLDADKVQASKGDAPAPLNLNAVDDADDLWALIIPFVIECAEKLAVTPPAQVTAAWTHHGQVAGLPAGTTPRDANVAAWSVKEWLIMWAESIEFLPVQDPMNDLFAVIRRFSERWTGDVERRLFIPRMCTVCGEKRVGAQFQDVDGVERQHVSCVSCGAVYADEAVPDG